MRSRLSARAKYAPVFFCLATLLLATLSAFADCACPKIEKGESTHWGGNELIIQVHEKPYKELRGVILDQTGDPMSGALVGLLTGPDYLLGHGPQTPEEKSRQRRLRACRTGADGKFCIHAKPGKYELRLSVGEGWDVTSVYLVIDDKKGPEAQVSIQMHLGT